MAIRVERSISDEGDGQENRIAASSAKCKENKAGWSFYQGHLAEIHRNGGESMQSYLCVGGNHDGLNWPAHASAETVQMSNGPAGRETYIRETLSVGDESVTIFRHESLTPAQVIALLVKHYKAWCVNRPGRR